MTEVQVGELSLNGSKIIASYILLDEGRINNS